MSILKTIIVFPVLGLVACASNPQSNLNLYTSLFESDCVSYYESIIKTKTAANPTPEEKEKLRKTMFKEYNFSKDASNSEEARTAAIKSAYTVCGVQKRLGVK